MDGRGRPSLNSTTTSSVMSSYGFNSSGSQPPQPATTDGNFSPRGDRNFWGPSNPSVGENPWSGYTPQIIPPSSTEFSTPSPLTPTGNSFGPQQNIPTYSNTGNGSNTDISSPFSGPSPPNQLQQIGHSPYPSSPRRQFTPSTTPSPHISINSSNQSPPNVGSTNGGINGNSNHSTTLSHSSNESPPALKQPGSNTFDAFLNGGGSGSDSIGSIGQVSNGHTTTLMTTPGKNGPNEHHPNDLPGYQHPRQQSLHNSGIRYPGEKGANGDMQQHYHQQQQQQQHAMTMQQQHYQNYYNTPSTQQQNFSQQQQYSNSQQQPPPPPNNYNNQQSEYGNRRPFEPYQPYQPQFSHANNNEVKQPIKFDQPMDVDQAHFEATLSSALSSVNEINCSSPIMSLTNIGGGGDGSKDEKSSIIKNEGGDKNENNFLSIVRPQSPNNINTSGKMSSGLQHQSQPKPNVKNNMNNLGVGSVSVPSSEGGESNSSFCSTSRESPNSNAKKEKNSTFKKFKKKAKAAGSGKNDGGKVHMSSEEKLELLCAESEREVGIFSGGKTIKEESKVDIKPKNPNLSSTSKDNHEDSSSNHHSEGDGETKKNVPMVECGCFPIDEVHSEPGPFYTHLGASKSIAELRTMIEARTGFRGPQIRFEKVIYTGKEGKTSQGCPLSKWIIRRGSYEEQLLFVIKHRKGHKCATAWIVVSIVIWDAVPPHFSDNLYDTLVYKLNRFGIPTTRRSDTNEQRSCACQGADPDTCGSAFSFGCAWSMFFNGCKYARSRNVRKFRLTEEHEEAELEEKVQHLSTHLGPLYERVAPESYRNQVEHENEGLECRLGYRPGRPFSGVTVCLDYCSHAHKDAHNMLNGCTLAVSFTRNRGIGKAEDEQYHVLPLYKLDDSDEFGSKEGQKAKVKKGQLELLKKYPSKVRVRKVPLLPSRRRGKVKPPAASSSSKTHQVHHHSHPHQPVDHYTDLGGPPMKREKLSLFEDLNVNVGSTAGMNGSDFFHHSHYPSANHHSFNADTTGLWNHFGQSQANHQSMMAPPHTQSSAPPPPIPQAPFRSYFDTNSSAYQPSSGSSFLGSSTSTPASLLDQSNPSRNSAPTLTPLVSGSCPPSIGSTPSTNYSSLSPILPSFRHTFMTDAEASSLAAGNSSTPSQSNNTTTNATNNNNSQRSHFDISSATSTSSLSSSPYFQGSSSGPTSAASLSSTSPSSGYGSSTGSAASLPTNPPPLYHPPSVLGASATSHHLPNSSPAFGTGGPSGFGNDHFGMGLNSWNSPSNTAGFAPTGYSNYTPAPQPTYHNSVAMNAVNNYMNPIGMGLAGVGINQHYSPYQNTHQMGMHGHSGHHVHAHHQGQWGQNLNPLFGTPPQLSHHHPPPPQHFMAPPKPKVIPEVNESFSDNEEAFKDGQLGGVGIALGHGSVIIQCAKHEMHATTALKNPNRMYPSKICLVYYQHKSMNNRFHGWSEWEKKIEMKKLQEVKLINSGKLEASPRKLKQLIKEGYIQDNGS